MSPPHFQPPFLRLVRGEAQPDFEIARNWFCGYCAAPAQVGALVLPHARVCAECGLGLMLEARVDVMPEPQDAFLVLDSRLLVQAVSRQAETVLGISEGSWIDQPVGELLVRADVEAGSDAAALSALILEAATSDDCLRAFVRPRETFGVRLSARIGSCGPPRAALLVLEGGRRRSLRAV